MTGRGLFASQGYAGTSAEQVLANAGMARGALFHHFRDKADLFAAVCEVLHAEAAAIITTVVTTAREQGIDALGRLLAGCDARLDYMSTGAARRILVLEAPRSWAGSGGMSLIAGMALAFCGRAFAPLSGKAACPTFPPTSWRSSSMAR
jgi:AcrR family transcriptional regulator